MATATVVVEVPSRDYQKRLRLEWWGRAACGVVVVMMLVVGRQCGVTSILDASVCCYDSFHLEYEPCLACPRDRLRPSHVVRLVAFHVFCVAIVVVVVVVVVAVSETPRMTPWAGVDRDWKEEVDLHSSLL